MKVLKRPAPLSSDQNETLLSMLPEGTDPEKVVFWDIETTGFSRRYDSIYLMGYFYWEGRTPYIEQHLICSTAEEIGLLENFLQKMDDFDLLVTYNGDSFDIPFVLERLRQMRVPGALKAFRSMDLYKLYRPYASFFGWKSCKLKALEAFLGVQRQDQMDGGELIEVFYEYSRTDDKGLERTLLLHNYEDILNLPQLLKIQYYVESLKHADVEALSIEAWDHEIHLAFALTQNPPLSITGQSFIHKKNAPILLSTDCERAQILVTAPLYRGTLRYYLPNYKEYYVLPSGQLLHKSLDTPPQKKTATRAECFLPKQGVFLPVETQETFQGLHMFRKEYKDKASYYELEELSAWIAHQDQDTLSLFLRQYLPF